MHHCRFPHCPQPPPPDRGPLVVMLSFHSCLRVRLNSGSRNGSLEARLRGGQAAGVTAASQGLGSQPRDEDQSSRGPGWDNGMWAVQSPSGSSDRSPVRGPPACGHLLLSRQVRDTILQEGSPRNCRLLWPKSTFPAFPSALVLQSPKPTSPYCSPDTEPNCQENRTALREGVPGLW